MALNYLEILVGKDEEGSIFHEDNTHKLDRDNIYILPLHFNCFFIEL